MKTPEKQGQGAAIWNAMMQAKQAEQQDVFYASTIMSETDEVLSKALTNPDFKNTLTTPTKSITIEPPKEGESLRRFKVTNLNDFALKDQNKIIKKSTTLWQKNLKLLLNQNHEIQLLE